MADAQLTAKIELETAQYQRGMKEVRAQARAVQGDFDWAEKSAKGFGVSIAKAAGSAAAAGINTVTAAAKGATIALGAATVAATGLFAYMVKEAGDAKQLLADAARLNIDTTAFQQYQYAVKQVGIESDKAADILKDVNDKIGDFITTGGSEAKDIFEKLSLSAEEFIGLSPDKALQKIADAAQGLTVQDKTFLFESIADDASLLLLLDEAGAKMNELKAQAMERGLILSPAELEGLAQFKSGLSELSERAIAFGQHVAAYMSKPIGVLVDYIDRMIGGFGGMDEAAMTFAENMVTGLQHVIRFAADVYAWFQEWKLVVKDVQAVVYALLDGLMKGAEVLLKYTVIGQAADKAAELNSGKSLSDGLAEQRKIFQGVLEELSEERAKTEQSITDVQKRAAETAALLGDEMRAAIEQARADMHKAKQNGYAAKQPESDSRRSRAEFQKRMETEAAKELEKQQKAAEKQMMAADKQLKAADGKQSPEDAALASLDAVIASMRARQAKIQAAHDARYGNPVAAVPSIGAETAVPTVVPQNKHITLNLTGNIGVNLSGNSDSLTQGIVASDAFKAAFGTLFETQLRTTLTDVARAVAA